jgi:pimeloyl-ACP methyl ester carboxylesterase
VVGDNCFVVPRRVASGHAVSDRHRGPTVLLFGSSADPGPELTWARGISLHSGGPVSADAVVGWSKAGLDAVAYAAARPGEVKRLVLLATPAPGDDVSLGFELSDVTAKTLLLFGAKDPLTGSRHGAWWRRNLPDARLEMHPDAGHDLLGLMWKRVLSHVAPGSKR